MRRMSPGPTGHFSAASLQGLALTVCAVLAIGSRTGWIAAIGFPPVSQAMTLSTLAALVALATTVAVAPLRPGLLDRRIGRWSCPFRPLDASQCRSLAGVSGPDRIGGVAGRLASPDCALRASQQTVVKAITPHPGTRRASIEPRSAAKAGARSAPMRLIEMRAGRPSRLHVRGPDGLETDRCRGRRR